jgi:uncharacterized membrane protein
MRQAIAFTARALFSGLLVIVPIYLATLLLLKGMTSVVGVVGPLAHLLPAWIPAEMVLSLLFVLLVCFLIGVAVRTRAGRAVRDQIERTFFEKIPGYSLLRSLTKQITGESGENVWKPALFESDEALLPAFIIEKFEDGRYTVFVPSIPTPFAGAVYILDPSRVHPLDVPFIDAFKAVSRWGSGAKDLVTAMERGKKASSSGSAPGVHGRIDR